MPTAAGRPLNNPCQLRTQMCFPPASSDVRQAARCRMLPTLRQAARCRMLPKLRQAACRSILPQVAATLQLLLDAPPLLWLRLRGPWLPGAGRLRHCAQLGGRLLVDQPPSLPARGVCSCNLLAGYACLFVGVQKAAGWEATPGPALKSICTRWVFSKQIVVYGRLFVVSSRQFGGQQGFTAACSAAHNLPLPSLLPVPAPAAGAQPSSGPRERPPCCHPRHHR